MAADKGMEVKGNDAASRDVERIAATGYDTGLPREHVEGELKKLYASCGEITDVCILTTRDPCTLWQCAFIYFVGEGAVDKAMQLNGTDMGGWTVSAEPYPFPEEENYAEVEIRDYDTSFSKIDIRCQLDEFFSSCGKISTALICDSFSVVFVVGEHAPENVPRLNGSYMGGHKVALRLVSHSEKPTVHPRPRFFYGRPMEDEAAPRLNGSDMGWPKLVSHSGKTTRRGRRLHKGRIIRGRPNKKAKKTSE